MSTVIRKSAKANRTEERKAFAGKAHRKGIALCKKRFSQ